MPRRAQLIRVLYSEIGRHLSHLLNVTTQAMDVGALTPPLWGFEEREKLMIFYERASGARMHAKYFRMGGVHQDLPPELIDDIDAWCESFPKVLDDIEGLLTENRIFKQRNVDIGKFTLEEAMDWGLSGVMIRSAGAAWDLRRAQPYECYSEMDFDIPIGKNGDCYDRYLMRMAEMREREDHEAVLREAAVGRRAGAGHGTQQEGRAAAVAEMKRSMEALIHHFKLYTEGFHVPAGEVYAAVEAPKGEFGVYLVSDGSNKPYRQIRRPASPTCRRSIRSAAITAGGHVGADRPVRHRVRRDRPVSVGVLPRRASPRFPACVILGACPESSSRRGSAPAGGWMVGTLGLRRGQGKPDHDNSVSAAPELQQQEPSCRLARRLRGRPAVFDWCSLHRRAARGGEHVRTGAEIANYELHRIVRLRDLGLGGLAVAFALARECGHWRCGSCRLRRVLCRCRRSRAPRSGKALAVAFHAGSGVFCLWLGVVAAGVVAYRKRPDVPPSFVGGHKYRGRRLTGSFLTPAPESRIVDPTRCPTYSVRRNS